MPAIATKLLLLLYFSRLSAPTGHLQVEININCLSKVLSIQQRIRCFCIVCPCCENYFNTYLQFCDLS
jgi:hypothetical protein